MTTQHDPNLKAGARLHARSTQDYTRTMLLALANVIAVLELPDGEIDPDQLGRTIEALRRVHRATDAALRDAQEYFDRFADAITPIPVGSPEPAVPPRSRRRPVAAHSERPSADTARRAAGTP